MTKRSWCALNSLLRKDCGWTEQSFKSNTMVWAVQCLKKFRLELQAFESVGSASTRAASSVRTCATKVFVRFPSAFCIVFCVPCLCLCLCVLSEETLLTAINNFAFWFNVATIPCEVLWNLFTSSPSPALFFFFPCFFPPSFFLSPLYRKIRHQLPLQCSMRLFSFFFNSTGFVLLRPADSFGHKMVCSCAPKPRAII